MKDNRRLLTYLFINVIVSACTILAVLWIWDPANRPAVLSPGGQNGVSTGNTAAPVTNPSTDPTPFPEEPTAVVEIPKGMINIEKIIGAGSAASEIVVLKRQGEGELQMTNWKLQDSNGNVYTFPALTLFKDGAVYVHTAAGADTVIDLYWNQGESLWQSGEKATLIDSQGNVQATYQIP
jgi:hypothetical protein